MTDMDSRRRQIAQGVQIGEHTTIKQSAAEALSGWSGRSHSRDDALTPRQWERMLRASYGIDNEEIALECRLPVVACGRLGVRSGEVTHLHEDWIEWNDGTIQIPTEEIVEADYEVSSLSEDDSDTSANRGGTPPVGPPFDGTYINNSELVFPTERWAATFRSDAQLILHELGDFLGYSPPPLLERLIEDAQKTHKQRLILQETLVTATQPRCET